MPHPVSAARPWSAEAMRAADPGAGSKCDGGDAREGPNHPPTPGKEREAVLCAQAGADF
jgi:hypothetical protein